jgi:uncharacterized membrane protein
MSRTLNNLINENLQTVIDLENALYSKFTPLERSIHRFILTIGRFRTVILHLIVFGFWIMLNSIMEEPWDPWPHDGLILFLACESILLTIMVLITQRIMQKLDTYRTHLALQISLLDEQETTKVLEIVNRIEKSLGTTVKDETLSAFVQQTNPAEVSAAIQKNIQKDPGDESIR